MRPRCSVGKQLGLKLSNNWLVKSYELLDCKQKDLDYICSGSGFDTYSNFVTII